MEVKTTGCSGTKTGTTNEGRVAGETCEGGLLGKKPVLIQF